jgi:geranylgeranyl reductase family protein
VSPIPDAVVVGAGPAGCVAAIVLARAGVQVLMVDRARFPRHKLCGDTVNPGALAILRQMGLDAAESGLPISGMIVTGPGGARVDADYRRNFTGRSLTRHDLDHALVKAAERAGVEIEEEVVVERPLLDQARRAVSGVVMRSKRGRLAEVHARLVIAADGRESRLARSLSLARYAVEPRRWAVGSYFANVAGLTSKGEMHIRADRYIGVAPLPGGLANACVVTASRLCLREPYALLNDSLKNEPALADRFQSAEMVARPVILGPLAVECAAPGMPGLLLAGDAAGFIDPMTGDGLRFALRGAELAAAEALRMLETGDSASVRRLAAARRNEFSAKWRFNRALRRLVGSADGLRLAGLATRVSSWPVSRIISYAGDVALAAS